VKTYTLRYHSIARNLSAAAQALLMKSSAPLIIAPYTEAGLTLVSDLTTSADPVATRTIIFQDSVAGGFMPPGDSMAEFLTGTMKGTIATGIQAPVTADAVVVT